MLHFPFLVSSIQAGASAPNVNALPVAEDHGTQL